MGRVKASKPTCMRPAITPEARENQLISLAVDLAEKKLMDGTASSQLIAHFLKLASSLTKLEREKIENENKLLEARVEAIKSGQHSEEMYKKAMDAMRRYSGQGDVEHEEFDD